MFTILRQECYIIKILVFLLFGSLMTSFGIIYFILKEKNIIVGVIVTILGIIFLGAGISMFFLANYKLDIFLGDNTLTVVEKAFCCRRPVTTNYQKNDLSRIEFTRTITKHRSSGRRGRRRVYIVNTFELFFIFKNGQSKCILKDQESNRTYTDEEMQFLVNYINNYINNQIRL